jgi:hypothetical protein
LIKGERLLPETLLKIEDLLSELVASLLVRIGLRIETLELLVLLEQFLTNPLGLLPLLLAKLFELLNLVGAQLARLRAIPAFSVTGAIASIVWAIPWTHHTPPVATITSVVGQCKPTEANAERHDQTNKNNLFHNQTSFIGSLYSYYSNDHAIGGRLDKKFVTY